MISSLFFSGAPYIFFSNILLFNEEACTGKTNVFFRRT